MVRELLTEQNDSTDGKESQDGADALTTRDDDNVIAGAVLANSRLNEGSNVPRVVAQAGGVSDLASLNDGTGSVAAGLVGSGALDTALLPRLGAARAGAGRAVGVA